MGPFWGVGVFLMQSPLNRNVRGNLREYEPGGNVDRHGYSLAMWPRMSVVSESDNVESR